MSSAPLISVCLPNLNNVRYLPERLDSILAQTWKNWELVAVDGYSDDGAWEVLCEYGRRDPRILLRQEPRAGIYRAFNSCWQSARGKYVYFATNDDTMEPRCLEVLAGLLESQPGCGMAQCGLRIIDAEGRPVGETGAERPWAETRFCRVLGDWAERPHRRTAPYDAFLNLAVYSTYKSVTQLLMRRELFGQVGPYPECYGSAGDFYWGMKAACLVDVAFTPEVLAGWRVHPAQATRETGGLENRLCYVRMLEDLMRELAGSGRKGLASRLRRFGFSRRYHEEALFFAAARSLPKAAALWLKWGWDRPAWMCRTAGILSGKLAKFDARSVRRALQREGVAGPEAI